MLRRRGSSLVELMVVVAIMLLVLGMLLPAAHELYTAVNALGSHH